MPTVNDLKSSKFLTKYDVTPPVLVTIKSFEQIDVSMENQAPDMKWCLHFKELDKPLVLNVTNGMLVEAIMYKVHGLPLSLPNPEDEEKEDAIMAGNLNMWIDKEIVLYNDPSVMFAGKLTGGIRVRASEGGQPNPDYVDPDSVPEPHPDIQEPRFCPDCGKPKGKCECIPF